MTKTKSIKAQLEESLGSDLERKIMTQIRQYGLPEPETQAMLIPGRKWRWDLAWPSKRLAVEVQGGIWTRGKHGRGSGILNDMDKLNAAQLAGWRVLQFAVNHIDSGEAVALIEKAILSNQSIDK